MREGNPVPAVFLPDMTWDKALPLPGQGPLLPAPVERRKGLGVCSPALASADVIQFRVPLPTVLTPQPPPSLRPSEPHPLPFRVLVSSIH